MEMTSSDKLVPLLECTLDTFVLNSSSFIITTEKYNTKYFKLKLNFDDRLSGSVNGDTVIFKLYTGKTVDTISFDGINSFVYSHSVVPVNYFRKRTFRRTLTSYRSYFNEEEYFQASTITNNLLQYDVVLKLNTVIDFILEKTK